MQTAARFFRGPVPPLPPQLASLPPLPERPLQLRRSWRVLRELLADPERGEKAFELFETLGGADDASFRRFAASAAGERLLRERPCLARALVDRDALAAMPEGSLGRAYLDFARRNGFAGDGLLQTRDSGAPDLNAGTGPERQWFYDRMTVMHDLWHVLSGYDTSEPGEIALLGFSRAQGLDGRAMRLFMFVGGLRGGRALRRFARAARRRGGRAQPLLLARYEELLPLPLGLVRAQLGIASWREAHADGIPLGVTPCAAHA
jgi:ubiquinone biosynthesis protein COQ4